MRREFSSSRWVATLTIYHSVVFLVVIDVLKEFWVRITPVSVLLTALFRVLATRIRFLVALIAAGLLDHLRATAFDLIAASANHAATFLNVLHAKTASLNFDVTVLFGFFLCDFGNIFLNFSHYRFNWGCYGFFWPIFSHHNFLFHCLNADFLLLVCFRLSWLVNTHFDLPFRQDKRFYSFLNGIYSRRGWLDIILFTRRNFNAWLFRFQKINLRSDLSQVNNSSFCSQSHCFFSFWNLSNQAEKHSNAWAIVRHSGLKWGVWKWHNWSYLADNRRKVDLLWHCMWVTIQFIFGCSWGFDAGQFNEMTSLLQDRKVTNEIKPSYLP